MTQFIDLGLAAPLQKALADEGYTTPTPIQAQAIPAVLAGTDIVGIAQTGTGKTAAFALPILHRLAETPKQTPPWTCRVLVLSPTRELASQIAESFRVYGRHLRVSVAVVYGGVAHRPQIQALSRGVDVLIATPGRLLDHMSERHAKLDQTEIFVLDEADQMLDLGFMRPIKQIVSYLPRERQSLFFSATMPSEIAGLASSLLKNPVRIAVTPVASTAERVNQRVIHVEHSRKKALLTELLADPGMSRTLVFTRTKRGADRVAKHLEAAGIDATAIHGNKSQKQREMALEGFRNARTRVLVATDIAARGIDIDSVSHVINFELPEVPEAYVHRIGRTARAGAEGSAVSLCDPDERDLLRAIERLTRQTITAEDRRHDASLAVEKAMPRERDSRARSGGGGGRGRERNGSGGGYRGDRGDRAPREAGSSPHRSGGYRPGDGAAAPAADAPSGAERRLRENGRGPGGNGAHRGASHAGRDRDRDQGREQGREHGRDRDGAAAAPRAHRHGERDRSAPRSGDRHRERDQRRDAGRSEGPSNGAAIAHMGFLAAPRQANGALKPAEGGHRDGARDGAGSEPRGKREGFRHKSRPPGHRGQGNRGPGQRGPGQRGPGQRGAARP